MYIPHISANFKFDDISLSWINHNISTIISDFDRDFPEQGGPIYNKEDNGSMKFQLAPPAIQLRKFLYSMGLKKVHIQMFFYKISDKLTSIENIHIDAPESSPLPARFNVLVTGNNNCKMHWWDIDINNPKVSVTSVPNWGPRWQIPGNNIQEQLEIIGEPNYSASELSAIQQTGDFVRTDIAHCIERDGERRVLISAQIRHPWEEITEKVMKWKNQ
jgi:hypothetical protein